LLAVKKRENRRDLQERSRGGIIYTYIGGCASDEKLDLAMIAPCMIWLANVHFYEAAMDWVCAVDRANFHFQGINGINYYTFFLQKLTLSRNYPIT
jgi:hypothetical protein